MGKFIVGTFLLLGWTFYEMSGGSDFEPQAAPLVVAEIETAPLPATSVAAEVETAAVARADTSALVTLASVSAPTIATPLENGSLVDTQITAEVAPEVTEVAPVTIEVAAVEPAPLDLRAVAGTRVNMRAGPGTNHSVLVTVDGGTLTEVLEVDATGWARIRLLDSGTEGWMAERLLTDS